MKKGITVYVDYDKTATWRLIIEKARGKLTLEDIMRAAYEYEEDHYLLYLPCYGEEFELNFETLPNGGDKAILYKAEELEKKSQGG